MSMLPEMMRWAGCIAVFAAVGLAVAADVDTVDQAERYREEMQRLRQEALSAPDDEYHWLAVSSALRLAFMARTGWGAPQDHEAALRWYELALDVHQREHPSGGQYIMYMLGRMHQHGLGVERDEEEALRWYKKAAAHIDGEEQWTTAADPARYEMAWRYRHGEGVPQDHGRAIMLYKWLAYKVPSSAPIWHGDMHMAAASRYALGEMYLNGEGIPADDKKCGVSGMKEHPTLTTRTPITVWPSCERAGAGVPQDNESAYMLATLAITGDPGAEWIANALAMQQELAAEMAPATIADLQARAGRKRAELELQFGRTMPPPLADLAERMDCYGRMNGHGSRTHIMKRFFTFGILPGPPERSAAFACNPQVSAHRIVVASIDEDGVADVLDSLKMRLAQPLACPISSMTTEGWGDIKYFPDNARFMSYSDGSKMAAAMQDDSSGYPPKLSRALVVTRCGREYRYIATDQGIWRRQLDRRGRKSD